MTDRLAPDPTALPATAVAVGVDVGGTNLRAAAVAADGTIVARESSPRPASDDPARFGEDVVAAIAGVADRLGPGLPIGVGIATAVTREGVLVVGANLNVDGFPLRDRLRDRTGREVAVVNDATAACLAEARVGAAVGCDDLVLVTVGTGVGGGAMVQGRLLLGGSGLAAEFGHLVVAEGGRRCPCGVYGCLEAYASGRAIGDVAAEWLAQGRVSAHLAHEPVVDGAAVHRAATAGDPLARAVVEEAGSWLGVGLSALVNALDPTRVLVGGGAGASLEPWLLPAARTAMTARVFGAGRRPLPPVDMAALGDDAGVVGAALLVAGGPG